MAADNECRTDARGSKAFQVSCAKWLGSSLLLRSSHGCPKWAAMAQGEPGLGSFYSHWFQRLGSSGHAVEISYRSPAVVMLRGTRRRLMESAALVLLVLGAISTVARVVLFAANTSSSVAAVENQALRHSDIQPMMHQLESQPEQRARAPHHKTKCFMLRDIGIIPAVRAAAKDFCAEGGWDKEKRQPVHPAKATKVSTFRVAGGIRSATFQNLMLDLTDAKIHSPIASVAQEGGKHDPRFNFSPRLINCACDELVEYFRELPANRRRREQIWPPSLMQLSASGIPMASICSPVRPPNAGRSAWDFIANPVTPPDNSKTVVFEGPVVLIARRDDHNPFFQVSSALNSWIMLQALGWDVSKTRVVHLDGGYPSPIDALHRGLLAPNHEIIAGSSLMGKRVHFRGDVLLAPFELSGPMMQHLNDDEPCYDSALFKKFRFESLRALNVTPEMEREIGDTAIRPMIVTVITRRPYGGRVLQRVWLNEDEVMERVRGEFNDLNVEFRSVEYANLTLAEQMVTTIESDMIISMHGAGLVNVLWARPMTTVLEIFPKERFRWGYRNLCQFAGCDWHEFRGGQDVGDNPVPNTKSKSIPYEEWMSFFVPLFNSSYVAFEKQQALLRGEAS
jgi:glycoprotein 2-beta-D-xylosyltransferase